MLSVNSVKNLSPRVNPIFTINFFVWINSKPKYGNLSATGSNLFKMM